MGARQPFVPVDHNNIMAIITITRSSFAKVQRSSDGKKQESRMHLCASMTASLYFVDVRGTLLESRIDRYSGKSKSQEEVVQM